MNKALKIFACIIGAVWLFVMGSQLGAFKAQRDDRLAGDTSVQEIEQTSFLTVPYPRANSEAVTSQTDSEPVSVSESETATPSEAEETTDESNDTSYEKIAELFNSAMNNTKTVQRTCNVKTVSTVKINVTDCSVHAALGPINSIIQRFAADNKEEEMLFTNGVSEDGLTILSQLPPMGKTTSLSPEGIASATIEPYGDGNKISITIVPETATLEKPPVHHSSSIGYVDAAALDIPATITQADMVYPGAQITLCTNADNLMVSYERVYPMSGSGTAEVGPLSGFASFEGSLEDKWVFEWA